MKHNIIVMHDRALFRRAIEVTCRDTVHHSFATIRRTVLLGILWDELYLMRDQLNYRVELRLEKYCFGRSAWNPTFYRDIGIVKKAFQLVGAYSGEIGHRFRLMSATCERNRTGRTIINQVADMDSAERRRLCNSPDNSRR